MKKLILVMGIMLLLVMSMVMAADCEYKRVVQEEDGPLGGVQWEHVADSSKNVNCPVISPELRTEECISIDYACRTVEENEFEYGQVKETNRFEKIKGFFVNSDDANKTQNRTMDQERMQMEQDARRTAEQDITGHLMAKGNQSIIPDKVTMLQEQMQIGERVRVQQQEKLFGIFNIDRDVEYEKTAIGPKRIRKMFDFMFKGGE